MKKGKLIESIRQAVLRQQPVLDSNKHVHFLTVEVELAKAYNSALKEFYYNEKNLENGELDFYAKKYDILVSKKDGVHYATLPVRPVELKRNLGIRSVKPKSTISNTTGSYSFIRTSETELGLIQELEVYCCSKKAFYYIDGDRIVLSYPVKEYALVEKVEVKLLPLFEEFTNDDNIEFPMGEMNATSQLLNIMGIRQVNNLNADDLR
jgi:hypothetical protein